VDNEDNEEAGEKDPAEEVVLDPIVGSWADAMRRLGRKSQKRKPY